jgi:hypothetical protein
MAFLETLFFPAAVFGPVDLREFRRLASAFRGETELLGSTSVDVLLETVFCSSVWFRTLSLRSESAPSEVAGTVAGGAW